MNKFIIHNKTSLSDEEMLRKVYSVVKEGKVSNKGTSKEQYCFGSSWVDGTVLTCDRKNDTYTFRLYYH